MVIRCIIFLLLKIVFVKAQGTPFDQNYNIVWAPDHIEPLDGGNQMRLFLDNSSGSGFESKSSFASGYFHMRIKLHRGSEPGVVTTFYLHSHTPVHDEIDFEFLGQVDSTYIQLQTNIFVNNIGNREESIVLWFDPADDFHDYSILWNPHQIAFLVDDIPIRVYKNKSNIGAAYPTQPMKIDATIWDGSDWATRTPDNNVVRIDWSKAPFNAYYKSFDINGCASLNGNIGDCYSPNYEWNTEPFWTLDPPHQANHDKVRNDWLVYNYCSSASPTPPECEA